MHGGGRARESQGARHYALPEAVNRGRAGPNLIYITLYGRRWQDLGGDLYFRELKMGTVHSSTGFRQDPEGAQRACEGLWPGSLSKSYYFYRFKKYHIWILSFTQLFLIEIYDGACFLKNNILNRPNPSFATVDFILFLRIRRFSYITSYIFAQASALVYIKF